MLITPKEAAAEFNISLQQVRRLIKARRWPIYRISERLIRVDTDEIRQLARVEVEKRESLNISGGKRKCKQ